MIRRTATSGYCLANGYTEKDAYKMLYAYQNTGLEPEEIEQLKGECFGWKVTAEKYKQAESEGRLIVLPWQPGEHIYVVERDENGKACDVSGYMFLSCVWNSYVIASPYINAIIDIDGTMAYHAQETAENYSSDLAVFPRSDCYGTREEAEAAMGGENNA